MFRNNEIDIKDFAIALIIVAIYMVVSIFIISFTIAFFVSLVVWMYKVVSNNLFLATLIFAIITMIGAAISLINDE
jgi:hypothetical protein